MSFKRWIIKHGPTILNVLGSLCYVGGTVLAVQATPAAIDDIYNEKRELGVQKLTFKDVIRVTWRHYLPSLLAISSGAALTVGAICTNNKQKAALAAAGSLATAALEDYKSQTTKELGEAAAKKLRDKIAQNTIDEHPAEDDIIIDTGRGTTLAYEETSGRYFWTDINEIYAAENKVNQLMNEDGWAPLNELYYHLGLDNTTIGDSLGWNIDDGLVSVCLSSCLDHKQRPCVVITTSRLPMAGYDSY